MSILRSEFDIQVGDEELVLIERIIPIAIGVPPVPRLLS